MQDKLGKEVQIGDQVVVATTCYKSAHLRLGTVKEINSDTRARVTAEVGGSTWVTGQQLVKV